MKAYKFEYNWSCGGGQKIVTANNRADARNLLRAYHRAAFPGRKFTILCCSMSTHADDIREGMDFVKEVKKWYNVSFVRLYPRKA